MSMTFLKVAQASATMAVVVISGCATTSPTSAPSPAPSKQSTADVLWLNRVTYGVNSESLAEYRTLGRARYLDKQLSAKDAPVPPAIAAQIANLDVSHAEAAELLVAMNEDNKRLRELPDGTDKEQAKKEINDRGNKLAYESARRHLLRAVYSPAQLHEQMTWFWLNHFSVLQYKANIRWSVADYEEHAIRPHVFGHFKDLVMATLKHPAMLQYLDNAQNAANHLNENYARELMELHVLGVDAGYTQQDVQELARVLTGVGVRFSDDTPKLKREWQPLYLREGAFEFNPARHDFESKTLLGQRIEGGGFGEVERAVDILVKQPSCARFISHKIAAYFVADDPPPALVDRMAKTFSATNGDIAAVLHTMFLSREFDESLAGKFKDPMHFVVSSVRLAYDSRPITNVRPIVNWLNALGEPLYGRQTPDGYPLNETGWASSGQMSRRFEIARAIGSGNAGLFDSEENKEQKGSGFPQLMARVYFDAVESSLSRNTQNALGQANSPQEWNTFLLSSPEFNYR